MTITKLNDEQHQEVGKALRELMAEMAEFFEHAETVGALIEDDDLLQEMIGFMSELFTLTGVYAMRYDHDTLDEPFNHLMAGTQALLLAQAQLASAGDDRLISLCNLLSSGAFGNYDEAEPDDETE